MKIQDYAYGIKQLALTALRDVVGGVTLDELLAERERIGKMVQEVVGKQAHEWGLEGTGIRLQQIDMPEGLKKIMSRQAAAGPGERGVPPSPRRRGTAWRRKACRRRRRPWHGAPAPCSCAPCRPLTGSAPRRPTPSCSPSPSRSWSWSRRPARRYLTTGRSP